MESFLNQKVLIRSYGAGVFFGTLRQIDYTQGGCSVVLEQSRRIHYWEGAASLSQVAQEGIKTGRVAMLEPKKLIIGVIEITPLSAQAIENLENQQIWKV